NATFQMRECVSLNCDSVIMGAFRPAREISHTTTGQMQAERLEGPSRRAGERIEGYAGMGQGRATLLKRDSERYVRRQAASAFAKISIVYAPGTLERRRAASRRSRRRAGCWRY